MESKITLSVGCLQLGLSKILEAYEGVAHHHRLGPDAAARCYQLLLSLALQPGNSWADKYNLLCQHVAG